MKNKKYLRWIIAGTFVIIAIIITYFFIAFSSQYSTTIYVEKLDYEPEQYFNMTYNQLHQWPYFKKAFSSKSVVEVPYSKKDQFQKLIHFLQDQESSNFMIDGSYYSVSLSMT